MKTINDIKYNCFNFFGNKVQCCATDELLADVLNKDIDSERYINLAYTNYGGFYSEKIFMQYLKEFHPNNIVIETTYYNGKNAIVFGNIVEDIIELTQDEDILAFEDFEDYYFKKECMDLEEAAKQYIEDNNIPKNKEAVVYDYFRDNVVMTTFGADYSESDLLKYLG